MSLLDAVLQERLVVDEGTDRAALQRGETRRDIVETVEFTRPAVSQSWLDEP